MQKHKKQIYLITGNKNKLKEFQQILHHKFILRTNPLDCNSILQVPELQGEPTQVAKLKALKAFKQIKQPILVEDTSLCFNAMGGLPGPYIKWFLQKLKPQGLCKMLQGFEDKTAYAQCIISYMNEQLKEPVLFIGRTNGRIVKPRGEGKFGWDPIFQAQGYDKTQSLISRYGQMQSQMKNEISHRFKAIGQMVKYFQ